jgi:hypothetical protein
VKFAGTGGHHHNGITEKAIQDVMYIARVQLLHAVIYWPEVANAQLWPVSVHLSEYIHKHMHRSDSGLSPHDLFTCQRWPHYKFHDLHAFGCPTYVLDKRIADGYKLPRWQPRSAQHIYLGFSKSHASTVPTMLNPETGTITAQFHVVFDDWFSMVPSVPEDLPNFASREWEQRFGDSTYQYPQYLPVPTR